MKTYSKKQDLINRLKLAVLTCGIIGIVMWLTSCSDEEAKDPFPGTWSFETDDIDATFRITTEGSDYYRIDQIKVNNEDWNDFTIKESFMTPDVIREFVIIKDISVPTENEEGIIFRHCKISTDQSKILIDSVIHQIGVNKTYLLNQVLERK